METSLCCLIASDFKGTKDTKILPFIDLERQKDQAACFRGDPWMKPPEGERPCAAIGTIGLRCRHQDIVDVRVMRYLTCKGAYREWNYPRKGGILYAARLEKPSHLTTWYWKWNFRIWWLSCWLLVLKCLHICLQSTIYFPFGTKWTFCAIMCWKYVNKFLNC